MLPRADNDGLSKLTPSALAARQAVGNLSQVQKGAIIIALLGPENAKPIIEAIDDRQLRSFVTAMQGLNLVPRPVLLATVADFITDMKKRSGGLRGGAQQARELAESMLDGERVNRLFAYVPADTHANDESVWSRLEGAKPSDVADYLNKQRPEMVSIILSNLAPAITGEIMGEMSDEAALAAAPWMAEGSRADGDTLDAISEVVEIEFLNVSAGNDGSASAAFMSDVLGVLPKTRRDKIMGIISEKNPEQADEIRRGLLTFEDLPVRLPKTAIPIIFRDMDKEDLLKALKAGDDIDPMTTGFLYGNISQRMAEQFKEESSDLAPLSEKETESAIIALMGFITRLEKAGKITYIEASEAPAMPAFEMDLPTGDD